MVIKENTSDNDNQKLLPEYNERNETKNLNLIHILELKLPHLANE